MRLRVPGIRRLALLPLALLPLVLLLALGVPAPAGTESARASFERGTELYEAEKYEEAAKTFRGILDTGVDDPIVHYNLANAYFKSGSLGPAIFHYRRAHALAPRDEDISANLEYARFLALDAVEGTAQTDQKVEGWIDRLTADEVLTVATVFWILAGIAAVGWQLVWNRRTPWRRTVVTLLVLWGIALVGAGIVVGRHAGVAEAVVIPREAAVRSGPGDSFKTAFVLHEGAEVVVEGDRGPWTEISLPGDLRGWIHSDLLARL